MVPPFEVFQMKVAEGEEVQRALLPSIPQILYTAPVIPVPVALIQLTPPLDVLMTVGPIPAAQPTLDETDETVKS